MRNIQYIFIVMHTLVIVRLVGRKGVNYNFSGGVAKAFCVMKELVTPWREAFRLDFLFLFDQAKRKLKDKFFTNILLNQISSNYILLILPYKN
jgi:hypothetical protein